MIKTTTKIFSLTTGRQRWTAVVITLAVMVRGLSAAQLPYTLLHSFSGADGDVPLAGLILDANGNLYGTTEVGGGGAACQRGCGTVFSVKVDGSGFTLLHSFAGGPNDGSLPYAGLTRDGSGNLYGTTLVGGAGTDCGTRGCGAVFKVKTDGTGYKVLHSFLKADGTDPAAGLILDASGNLYGTAEAGGNAACPQGCGTVFKVKNDGTGYEVLHSFSKADGNDPTASLILDATGNLYGTTQDGGAGTGCAGGCGTIFKVKTDGTGFTLLHSFSFSNDGAGPDAGLILDANGNLYGTAIGGGPSANCGTQGCGSVFKIKTDGTGFKLLRWFSGADCGNPEADLILDANGNLYGTAVNGGSSACNNGCGAIFRISTSGTGYTVLHAFSGADGAYPDVGLVLDANGNLYSTTELGGASSICSGGCGTVFKLALQAAPITVHRGNASGIAALSPIPISGRNH